MSAAFPTATLLDGDVHVVTGTYNMLAAHLSFHHFPERLRVEGVTHSFSMTGREFLVALRSGPARIGQAEAPANPTDLPPSLTR